MAGQSGRAQGKEAKMEQDKPGREGGRRVLYCRHGLPKICDCVILYGKEESFLLSWTERNPGRVMISKSGVCRRKGRKEGKDRVASLHRF
jgi:hypothetical protein